MTKVTATESHRTYRDQLVADLERMLAAIKNTPDTDVDWATAGTTRHFAHSVREIADQMFHEGEYIVG